MKYVEVIAEATSRRIDRVEELERWQNDPDIYVSFTTLPKVGINPRSEYDTPLGIYAYPLREMFQSIKADNVPFAGDAPYIQVLQSDRVTELSQYSNASLERDIATLREGYIEPLMDALWDTRRLPNQKWWHQPSEFRDIKQAVGEFSAGLERDGADNTAMYDQSFDFAMTVWANEATHQNHPASKLWNITRMMSAIMTHRRPSNPKGAQPRSIAWNAMLRKLGYDAFSDKTGIGIIHENEPISAVFLTRQAFRHIVTVSNVIRYAGGTIWRGDAGT